ncbi:MAG TPA: glycerol-3-phosphate 1-O-acyltransferase PlsY [Kofleriaceae bacterium]|nr:glycerol-3-phosphate 1-O-acyltransferase PlsY [Kofleriaceae bacterium]
MDLALAIAIVLAAYLLGSIPFGLLIGKRMGVDVRKAGSGNIGATNVARTVGKKVGALVLLLDALKGAAPLAAWVALDLGERIQIAPAIDPYLLTAVGLAPILGHCFPVWLGFRGGKGVATALGVFLVMDPLVILLAAALFAALYLAFRIVSIGSLSAALAVPILSAVLGRPAPVIALGAAGALVVFVKHRGNIARLLRRSELKV